jgi:hypothetical protein
MTSLTTVEVPPPSSLAPSLAPSPPPPQHCLFDSLPETEPRRRRGRRPAAVPAPAGLAEPAAEPESAASAAPPRDLEPAAAMVTVTMAPAQLAASLTNPELVDLVRALPDSLLAHLLSATVREVRRRLAGGGEERFGIDDDSPVGQGEPNPVLLRAVRNGLAELAAAPPAAPAAHSGASRRGEGAAVPGRLSGGRSRVR